MELERPRESRKRQRKYCEHCDCFVAKTTYYIHRNQFYDKETNVWKKDNKRSCAYTDTSSDSDVEIEDGLHCYDSVAENNENSDDGGKQLNCDDSCDSDESPEELQGR